ncbi:hypothetical protein PR048_025996 [Dryococelus australis]|uniref:Uncharacterized protein n=1 Tax=Dryococelus australis TaxID=614101 RepID=A0ABQ9GK44_9NEOP|nr:hypothetical protein PR048_025996 [Dryococelus australis]
MTGFELQTRAADSDCIVFDRYLKNALDYLPRSLSASRGAMNIPDVTASFINTAAGLRAISNSAMAEFRVIEERAANSEREDCDCVYQTVACAAGRLDYWTICSTELADEHDSVLTTEHTAAVESTVLADEHDSVLTTEHTAAVESTVLADEHDSVLTKEHTAAVESTVLADEHDSVLTTEHTAAVDSVWPRIKGHSLSELPNSDWPSQVRNCLPDKDTWPITKGKTHPAHFRANIRRARKHLVNPITANEHTAEALVCRGLRSLAYRLVNPRSFRIPTYEAHDNGIDLANFPGLLGYRRDRYTHVEWWSSVKEVLTLTGSWQVMKTRPTELRRPSSERQPMELLRRPDTARPAWCPSTTLSRCSDRLPAHNNTHSLSLSRFSDRLPAHNNTRSLSLSRFSDRLPAHNNTHSLSLSRCSDRLPAHNNTHSLSLSRFSDRLPAHNNTHSLSLSRFSDRLPAHNNTRSLSLSRCSDRLPAHNNTRSLSLSRFSDRLPAHNNTHSLSLSRFSDRLPAHNNTHSLSLSRFSDRLPAHNNTRSLNFSRCSDRLPAHNNTRSLGLSRSSDRLPAHNNTRSLGLSRSSDRLPAHNTHSLSPSRFSDRLPAHNNTRSLSLSRSSDRLPAHNTRSLSLSHSSDRLPAHNNTHSLSPSRCSNRLPAHNTTRSLSPSRCSDCLPAHNTTHYLSPCHAILACGNRSGRCRWSAGFFGDIHPPSPPIHYNAASILTSITLIGSQYLGELVHATPVDNVDTFHNRIVAGCETIRNFPGIHQRIRVSMQRRVDACVRTYGGGLEQPSVATGNNVISSENLCGELLEIARIAEGDTGGPTETPAAAMSNSIALTANIPCSLNDYPL